MSVDEIKSMKKDVYLNGEFIVQTENRIELIFALLRQRYGEGVRLLNASEEVEIHAGSVLRMEFIA